MILLLCIIQPFQSTFLKFDDEHFHNEFMVSLNGFTPNRLPLLSTGFHLIREQQFFPFQDHLHEMDQLTEKFDISMKLCSPTHDFPIQLFQLKNAVDLNEQFGLIKSYDQTSAKFVVQLCKNKARRILVKVDNLKILKVASQRWKIQVLRDKIAYVALKSVLEKSRKSRRIDLTQLQKRPALTREKIAKILMQNDWRVCDAMDVAAQHYLGQSPIAPVLEPVIMIWR